MFIDVSLVDIDGMAAIHWSVYKNDTSCLKVGYIT